MYIPYRKVSIVRSAYPGGYRRIDRKIEPKAAMTEYEWSEKIRYGYRDFAWKAKQ